MTATAPHPTVSVTPSGRKVNWPKLTFLGVLLLVFAVYTELAMGMEWRTQAGRIGPGFFPRILGKNPGPIRPAWVRHSMPIAISV